MFEDSTFESTGRLRTRSRGWMIAAFLFNGSILLALVLIPLIYPEALPRQMMSILLEAPAPSPAPPPVQPAAHPSRDASEMQDGHILAPPRIPNWIRQIDAPESPGGTTIVGAADLGAGPEIPGGIFQGHSQAPVVHQAAAGPVRLPSTSRCGIARV